MDKKSIKDLEKKLQKEQAAIAKNRDNLDNLIGDYQQLREDCDEAWRALQDARDALSRLV